MLSHAGVGARNSGIPEAGNPYRLALALLAIAAVLLTAQSARATFPGENGRISHTFVVDGDTSASRSAIFVTGVGQVTSPAAGPPTSSDNYSVWSPDGEFIAYWHVNGPQNDYEIRIVAKDGTGDRLLISSDAFDQSPGPGQENAQITTLGWSPDGERIAFAVRHSARTNNEGIWTVRTDGTDLVQRVNDLSAEAPDWSPNGTEIAYACRYRNSLYDICTVNVATGARREIPLDVVGKIAGPVPRPKWMPDGSQLVFALLLLNFENNHNVVRNEIFTVGASGTPLTRLTHTPDGCPGQNMPGGGTTTANSNPLFWYADPVPSPDGKLIAFRGFRNLVGTSTGGANTCSYTNLDIGIWTMSANGSSRALLVPGLFAHYPSWQPIPAELTVHIDDGHGNPMRGLKVDLLDALGVYDDNPLNTSGGTYVFEDIPAGEYTVRATLIDHEGYVGLLPPPYTPSFEIRHGPQPAEAAWIEWVVTLEDAPEILRQSFEFSGDMVASSVDASQDWDRLDDLANLFFRTRQFVDWVKSNLTPTTGNTVAFHAYATTDPTGGAAVAPNAAFHRHSANQIVLGVTTSAYENRDGIWDAGHFDDAPENVEWHEYTHHLYATFVAPYDCAFSVNHAGYLNPSSCDSLFEGFANFLPAWGALTIDVAMDTDYDGFINLEAQTKAWGLRAIGPALVSTEDLAVPALLWDLVDASPDTEARQVIAANGTHLPVTYTDSVSFSLSQIWSQLVSAKPRSIRGLRESFGAPAISINLDGATPNDIAPLDAVFIMHGFYPVELDQVITPTHQTYHYDVAYTQRTTPGQPRNSHVGLSSHRVYDAAGNVTLDNVPRGKTPIDENANLLVDVRDASGTPLDGSDLRLQVQYPGIVLPQTVVRRLGNGAGSLAHLELPAYFDYLLPTDAPLPPCGAAGAVQVSVTATTQLNGFSSPDVHTFDNCSYWQAIAAATGPDALSLSFTFPEDSTPPVTAIAASASVPPVGTNTAGTWEVSFSCSDPEVGGFASGCRPVEYRIDGGALESFLAPFELDEVGEHVIEYRAFDAAGNAEPFNTATFGVIGSGDSDTDGILDPDELALGTDPFDPDSDDDGLADGDELTAGTNPLDSDSDDDGALDGNEVLGGTNPLDPDSDDDGDLDGADNCPRHFNPDQLDSGGLASPTPNGRGDVCECGDVTGNGIVDAADVTAYRTHLVGPVALFPAPANSKCSVYGATGSTCDVVDVTVIQRALLGALPALQGNCSALP
jgi:hypothetical protein